MKNAFCRIQIDFDALLYNYRQVKNLHPELMPVIKANAYAHGAVEIARFFEKQGVKYFATGTIYEALELREKGIANEIIPLLGALTDEEYKKRRRGKHCQPCPRQAILGQSTDPFEQNRRKNQFRHGTPRIFASRYR